MAQSSRPQAGNILVQPTYVDSGPYNEDQWGARLFRKVFTTDQQATQGVLLGVDNELAVTFGVGTLNVYVATGAGFCNGHFFENTASVTIVVDAPAGGTRQDYVCMVENNRNTGIPAGAATNYNTEGNATIPPYSCRLAVIKNGPANFSQTATLFMTRLATLNTQAAFIGAITDNRVFCQYATDLQNNVVTTTKILDLAVTKAKLADVYLELIARQGGSATAWNTAGTTNYTLTAPTSVVTQVGAITTAAGGTATITFPVAFSQIPLVYLTIIYGYPNLGAIANVEVISATQAQIRTQSNAGANISAQVSWLAIGAE